MTGALEAIRAVGHPRCWEGGRGAESVNCHSIVYTVIDVIASCCCLDKVKAARASGWKQRTAPERNAQKLGEFGRSEGCPWFLTSLNSSVFFGNCQVSLEFSLQRLERFPVGAALAQSTAGRVCWLRRPFSLSPSQPSDVGLLLRPAGCHDGWGAHQWTWQNFKVSIFFGASFRVMPCVFHVEDAEIHEM